MKIKVALAGLLVIGVTIVLILVFSTMDRSDGYRVGISNGFVGNNWRNQMFEELYVAIEYYEHQGLIEEVVIKNAGTDIHNQIEQIRHLIKTDVDLLLIDPNTAHGLNEVIEEAYEAGILVIIFDQSVTSDKAIHLTIDQKNWGGRQLAIWMKDQLDENGNIIIMEGGVKDQPCNDERLEGILEVIEAHPRIRIIDKVYGDWDQATAKKKS